MGVNDTDDTEYFIRKYSTECGVNTAVIDVLHLQGKLLVYKSIFLVLGLARAANSSRLYMGVSEIQW